MRYTERSSLFLTSDRKIVPVSDLMKQHMVAVVLPDSCVVGWRTTGAVPPAWRRNAVAGSVALACLECGPEGQCCATRPTVSDLIEQCTIAMVRLNGCGASGV